MILPTNIPWRLVGAGAALLALVAGVLFLRNHWISLGEASGRAEVQATLDHTLEEIARQSALQEATARAKEEADRQAALEIQNELESSLRDVTERADSLARRLRDYQSRDRARRLSEAAAAASGAGSAPGESSDSGEAGTAVDLALEAHLGACARDAERLAGWQEWWGRVN